MRESSRRRRKDFRILILEDTSPLRRLLDQLLRDEGYEVIGAGDSQSALDLALRVCPHLAILDVRLPGLGGFALAHILRANPGTAQTNFIFMSGRQTEEDREEAAELGAIAYLEKPFTLETFLKMVRNQFDRHRSA